MAYAAWSVIAGEQPTAAKWNILGTNDASFNDGTGIGTSAITTVKLNNASVTADKLGLGAVTAVVATAEDTTSATYAALATAGPAVTTTIGLNQMALVIVTAQSGNATATAENYMGFDISGSTTVAASDAFADVKRITDSLIGGKTGLNGTFLVTGLTAGSNTFTAKYRTNASTARFSARKITVIPL